MVAHAALAIFAVLALAGGVSVAAATGAFGSASNGNIDLGTLVPGQSGNVTASTTLHVTNSTTYKFQLEKEDRIGGTFSTFAASVSVNGHTYNLTSNESDSHLNLSTGSYKFTLHLSYTVRDHAPSVNQSKVAFLFLHPIENDSQDLETQDHNKQGNTTTDGSLHFGAAGDSGQAQQNNSTRLTLFTLSFTVNGASGISHEDQNQSTNSNKDSIQLALP